jgi:hypothetical protein
MGNSKTQVGTDTLIRGLGPKPIQAVQVATRKAPAVDEHLTHKEKLKFLVCEMGKLPQVSMPTKHYFAPGTYIREIFMPAGTYVIGKIHKTEHFNIIQKGRLSLVNEDGTSTELQGPLTFVSKAGVQKAMYIHEDTVWSTVHITNERNMEALEAEIIEADESYPSVEREEERRGIEQAAAQETKLLECA